MRHINDIEAYNEDNHFQKPFTTRELNGRKIAVIGQAFIYTDSQSIKICLEFNAVLENGATINHQ